MIEERIEMDAGGRAATIALCMIVRNEMANLERCLSSVAPYIGCWVIGDTGSSDGSQDWIRAFFAARDIPGELHEFPFHDFAQARNEALRRARGSSLQYDYLLLTDADMELTVSDPRFASSLTAEAYQILQRSSVSYWNTRLLRRDAKADYRGVTHEYLDLREGRTLQTHGLSFIDHATGANRVDKFDRDARLLRAALATERDPGMIARYTFYLANTYRDAGQLSAALPEYEKRATQGFWDQEVFISLYNAALLREALEQPTDDVLAAYDRASAALPTRAEALHDAARLCRKKGLYERGYDYARKGLAIAPPADGLFVVDWIYEYGLLDEFSINAYWTGRFAESVEICDQLLNAGKIPHGMRERVQQNRQLAVDRLRELGAPTAGSCSLAAALKVARKLEELNCPAEHVLAAYERAISLSPEDPEVLLEAARYCRLHGDNDRGAAFAEKGLGQAHGGKPELKAELLQELSITANYSKSLLRYTLGHAACEWLALSRHVLPGIRDLASRNLLFYAKDAPTLFPTYQARKVSFSAPAGYTLLNPSVARFRDGVALIQRTANYRVSRDGRFYTIENGGPVHTRNFLLALDDHWDVVAAAEVLPPADMPPPVFKSVLGFEDMRLFTWHEQLWVSATVREANARGLCEQYLARIKLADMEPARLVDWWVMQPEGEPVHQKNWMPWLSGDSLRFIACSDPTQIRDGSGKLLIEHVPPASLGDFRGGSQLISFDGGWLALVHEVTIHNEARFYLHRFVYFDETGSIAAVSQRFYFHRKGIEFVAGLAWHPDGERVIVSFGVGDEESWLATIRKAEVEAVLHELAIGPQQALRPMRALTLDANAVYCSQSVAKFVAGQTNRALRDASAITFAASALCAAGLPVHPDRPKAWDSFLAIYYALRYATRESAILDAGAGIESSFLPSLAMLGYGNLTGINLLFKEKQRIGDITYEFGDITATPYPAGHFAFASCLSVVEHGVDVQGFLAEMARILRPGGFLFLSVDYWTDPVDTKGITMFDAPFRIFNAEDMEHIISLAQEFGLVVHGDAADFGCDQRLISNVGLQYTFANLLLMKAI